MPGAAPAEAGGQIQRSFDGGRTWESVFLNDGKGFQAVASSGSHVWAGGSHGILFYSPDAGSHWARIGVADGNARLTDAIVNIEAQSPDRTKLTTKSGEEWLGFRGNWRELRDVERPGK